VAAHAAVFGIPKPSRSCSVGWGHVRRDDSGKEERAASCSPNIQRPDGSEIIEVSLAHRRGSWARSTFDSAALLFASIPVAVAELARYRFL